MASPVRLDQELEDDADHRHHERIAVPGRLDRRRQLPLLLHRDLALQGSDPVERCLMILAVSVDAINVCRFATPSRAYPRFTSSMVSGRGFDWTPGTSRSISNPCRCA